MSRIAVVELRLVDRGKMVVKARFVLLPSGIVEIVPIEGTPEGVRVFIGDALPGPDGPVTPEHGQQYLDALRATFRGDYVWVTDSFEMELEDALKPVRAPKPGTTERA